MGAGAGAVEWTFHLEALRTLGCDDAQGFLLGRPLPADAFAAQLGG